MNNKIEKEILNLASDVFNIELINKFNMKLQDLTAGHVVLDYFLQISTDQGEELELGFFSKNQIFDITLSNGKIYSYSYPVTTISEIGIKDLPHKTTLFIQGEKKFDYNVVKPNSLAGLNRYESSLRNLVSIGR